MSYKEYFNEIKDLEPKKRGFEFEKLINRIFDDAGILLSNSYKTSDMKQQIDGAIEINSRIFLIESKWENSSTLAASKLYSFMGKINSKIEGTFGIFISFNELSDNILSAARDGLRQNCIVIHGENNVIDIIEGKVDIKGFLWYAFQQVSTKNRISIDTSEYISLPSIRKMKLSDRKVTQESEWDKISELLLDSTPSEVFTTNLESLYKKNSDLYKKTLNIFAVVYPKNKDKYLILIGKCLQEEKSETINYLIEKLKSSKWKDYVKYNFLNVFKEHIANIDSDDKNIILNTAINHLENNLGNYDEENNASELINFLFKYLEIKDLENLAKVYLEIYCDEFRKDKYIQKQIANKIFNKLKSEKKAPFYIVKEVIIEKLKDEKRNEYFWKDHYDNIEMVKGTTLNSIFRKFSKVINKDEYKKFLKSKYDEL